MITACMVLVSPYSPPTSHHLHGYRNGPLVASTGLKGLWSLISSLLSFPFSLIFVYLVPQNFPYQFQRFFFRDDTLSTTVDLHSYNLFQALALLSIIM